jgi:hypothetical protein
MVPVSSVWELATSEYLFNELTHFFSQYPTKKEQGHRFVFFLPFFSSLLFDG